jgi:hypothetical protein
MTPVVVLNDKPAERAGLMLELVMVPPEELGPIGNIVMPRSNTIGDA